MSALAWIVTGRAGSRPFARGGDPADHVFDGYGALDFLAAQPFVVPERVAGKGPGPSGCLRWPTSSIFSPFTDGNWTVSAGCPFRPRSRPNRGKGKREHPNM